MGATVRVEHPHKTTVVTAGSVFVLYDEFECLSFRQTTDGRRWMECVKQITQMLTIRQLKSEITPQMNQIGCTDGTWTLLPEITRKLFQTLCYIGGDDALLLDVLRSPGNLLTFAHQRIPFQLHRARQGYRMPVICLSLQQDLRSGYQPYPTLGGGHQRDEHPRVQFAGTAEEYHRVYRFFRCLFCTTGQDYLTEDTGLELGMIVGKVYGVCRIRGTGCAPPAGGMNQSP